MYRVDNQAEGLLADLMLDSEVQSVDADDYVISVDRDTWRTIVRFMERRLIED